MTEKDEKLLAEFEIRMRQLMLFCNTLREQNHQLREQITHKNTKIELLTLDLEKMKAKYDNLKFAKSFASTDMNEVNQARERISKLVQDVDKCITMLKK